MVAEGFVVVVVFKLFGCTVCGTLIPQPGIQPIASPLTTKPPRKSLQRFVMSFPWAWGKCWEWPLRMSSGVRIPKVEWVGHCTCFWNKGAWLETVQGQLYTSVWVDPLSWSQGGILMTSYTVFSHPTVLTAHSVFMHFHFLTRQGLERWTSGSSFWKFLLQRKNMNSCSRMPSIPSWSISWEDVQMFLWKFPLHPI